MDWILLLLLLWHETRSNGTPQDIYTRHFDRSSPIHLDRQASTNSIAFPLAIKTLSVQSEPGDLVLPDVGASRAAMPRLICMRRTNHSERSIMALSEKSWVDEWRTIVLSSGRGLPGVIQIHLAANRGLSSSE